MTCDANIQPCGREGKKTLLDQDLSGTVALVGWGIQVPFRVSCTISASTNVAYAYNLHAALNKRSRSHLHIHLIIMMHSFDHSLR